MSSTISQSIALARVNHLRGMKERAVYAQYTLAVGRVNAAVYGTISKTQMVWHIVQSEFGQRVVDALNNRHR